MPVHTLECRDCGKREDKFVSDAAVEFHCGCGGYSRVVYDWGKCNNIEVFEPYWETNLGDKPIKIESKQHLAQECKARGLMANRLRDGYRSFM